MTGLAAAEIDRPAAEASKGFDLALDRIRRLLSRLGDPQNQLPPVLHVAGTNGKGSVVAFARAILEADGKRCIPPPRRISSTGTSATGSAGSAAAGSSRRGPCRG